jgi:DNA repair protein SbcC/Rad50
MKGSVKTLSGGESFMASMALALALSNTCRSWPAKVWGARLEAVFVDEGLGSLGPETLEEVIDSLERLREEDLLVGVIGHVPTLADRIRSGLEVHEAGGRSTISEGRG